MNGLRRPGSRAGLRIVAGESEPEDPGVAPSVAGKESQPHHDRSKLEPRCEEITPASYAPRPSAHVLLIGGRPLNEPFSHLQVAAFMTVAPFQVIALCSRTIAPSISQLPKYLKPNT